jgi:hypothetical protein
MKRIVNTLPDPTPDSVVLWLSQLDRKKLHNTGWPEVNRRFHAIARSVRPFIREQYPDAADQEAVFDGFTLALLTMGHFADIEQLNGLSDAEDNKTDRKLSPESHPQEDSLQGNG